MKHTFHVVSLPHTQTTAEYNACAYTQKVRKFAKMMTQAGHDVVVYSGEDNDAECTEHVVAVTKAQQLEWFGPVDQTKFYPITWEPDADHWREMNFRAAQQIRKKAAPRDFVLLIAGTCQEQVARDLPGLLSCEWGIGYSGIFSDRCAFESYAWMHHVYASSHDKFKGDGRWFDAVIPNFFDEDEFPEKDLKVKEKTSDYLLYLGRLIHRKGVTVALSVAHEAGLPLVVAGQGATEFGRGYVQAEELRLEGDVEYVGLVDVGERSRLMAGAVALLAPTIYVEPFGGVAVEAMMAGCPAITTDWGAFTETVRPGVSGYRFRTLGEGAEAVELSKSLDRSLVREYALQTYSLPVVARQYEAWFDRLSTLWGQGWNDRRGRLELAGQPVE